MKTFFSIRGHPACLSIPSSYRNVKIKHHKDYSMYHLIQMSALQISQCYYFKTGMWHSYYTKGCPEPKREDDFILNSLDQINLFLLATSFSLCPFLHQWRSPFLFKSCALEPQENVASLLASQQLSRTSQKRLVSDWAWLALGIQTTLL